MQLKQVIIIHKAGDSLSQEWAETCARQLEKLGCHVLVGPSGPNDNPYPVFLASISHKIDLGIVLGGDGTTLAAARNLAPVGTPILAVNVGGHLGFLTEPFEVFQDSEAVWQRLLNDRYAVQRRMMLQAYLVEGDRLNPQRVSDHFLALNEICIKPASIDRMPTSILEMEIDSEVVDQYHGDGLIISTPTGSTCYNASANGPILHSGMDAIAITPICPLSLSTRPIVVPPGSVINVWPLGDVELYTKLWSDGVLASKLWPGQRISIRMAECQAKFIILRPNHSFYKTLREKLHWSGIRITSDNGKFNRIHPSKPHE